MSSTMMMLVGGYADGCGYEVKDGVDYIEVAENPNPDVVFALGNANREPTYEAFRTHTYRRDGRVFRYTQ